MTQELLNTLPEGALSRAVRPALYPASRRLLWLVLLLGTWATGWVEAETPAVAQARAPLKLLRAAQVQAELGLEAAQVQAIDSALERVDGPLWRIRDLPADQADGPAQHLNDQTWAALKPILRPQQLARLEQLLARYAGWQGLQLPSVVERLELDATQKQHYADFLGQMNTLPGKSIQSLRWHESAWIRTQLTSLQRQKLNQMLGAPFDFSQLTIREVKAPELRQVQAWINSPALSLAQLRGKVVVVNFWTFGCINCIHNLPHYRQWQTLFPTNQVVQIGIHTPETTGEHDLQKLRQAVHEKGLTYPIAVDNQRANWDAWGNNIWPSVYLIDKEGYVRYWWYGELNWQGAPGEQQMRNRIYQLLAEKPVKQPIHQARPSASPTLGAN